MFPAHIRETGERQTVQKHCRNTAALAATALRLLGGQQLCGHVGIGKFPFPAMPPVQQKPDAGEGVVDTATDGVPAADSLRKVLRILLFVFSGVVEQTDQIGAFFQAQWPQRGCGQRRSACGSVP